MKHLFANPRSLMGTYLHSFEKCIVDGLLLALSCIMLIACSPRASEPTVPPPTAIPTATITLTPTPTRTPAPTPMCVQPMLTIGTTKFRIESIKRAADGSVAIPANVIDVAYWVQGTPPNFVFGLSNVASNLGLKAKLKANDPLKIAWADCSTEDYVIKTIESAKPDIAKLLDPASARVSVFFQSNVAAENFIVKGGLPEPQVKATPVPTDANVIQADINFLSKTISPDRKTLKQSISIKNTGNKNISLTTKDISLTVEGTPPIAPTSVDPALPQTIAPGANKTLTITFTIPAAKTAVFKVLDFTIDLYF